RGELALKKDNVNYALIGSGVEITLSLDVSEKMYPLQVYYIKDVKRGTLDPSKLYSQRAILPGAVFSIVQNFDDNYVIVPIEFAQNLFSSGNRRTSLEIKVKEGVNPNHVQQVLEKSIGQNYYVLNHEEQH